MKKRYYLTVLIILCLAGVTSTAFADSNISPSQAAAPLLDRIALGEGSGYDTTYAYGQYNPENSKQLTDMTIGEVKTLQKQMLANQKNDGIPLGKQSSAVGKYQIIDTTLSGLEDTLGLSDNTPFDAATQDELGLALLNDCGFSKWIKGVMSDHDFQKNLAKKWASVADPDTGKSYYGQSVGTTNAQIKEAMAQTKTAATAFASTVTQYGITANPLTLVSPGSSSEPGDIVSTLAPTLEWNSVPNADYYALYVSKYPYGTANIIFDSGKSYGQLYGSSFNLPSGYLQDGIKYRWNMKAHSSSGWSSISNTLYFQTAASLQASQSALQETQQGSLTSQPTLVSPGSSSEPGDIVSTLAPTLEWNSVPNADYFALYISKYPYGTANIIFDSGKSYGQLYGSSFNLPSGYLQDGIKYRWNMKAHSSSGWSSISNTLYFQTAPLHVQPTTVTLTLYVHEGGSNGPTIPGASVTGHDGSGGSFQGTTNGNGYTTIAGYPGTWSFTASASGYTDNSWSQSITTTGTKHAFLQKIVVQQAPVQVNSQPISTPQPTTVTLTLYVHEGGSNGPTIPGASVTGHDGSGGSFQGTTNGNGYTTIAGYPGTWSFTASASGYTDNSWSQSITTTGTKHAFLQKIVVQQAPVQVNSQPISTPQPTTVTLTLYVHEGGSSGPTIPGASVTGHDGSGGSFQGTTNGNGYTTIAGYPGTWSFTASASGYTDNSWSQSITTTGTKHAFLQKIVVQQAPVQVNSQPISTPQPTTVTLTLYVHEGGSSGPTIPGASVTGHDGSGGSFQGTTNSNGYTTIAGYPGTWSFTASASGYTDNSWSQSITTTGTKHAFLQKIVVQQAPVQVNSQPISTPQPTTVTLTLYVHEGGSSGPTIPGASVTGHDGSGGSFQGTTNGNGYTTIAGYPGTWSFTASASGYTDNSWSQSITTTGTKHAFLQKIVVQQAPVQVNSQPISTPQPTTVTLTLYVHEGGSSGPTIPGASVTGHDGSGGSFQGTTNSNGYTTIAGYPGTWSFTASASGYTDNSWSQSITTTGTKHAFLQK